MNDILVKVLTSLGILVLASLFVYIGNLGKEKINSIENKKVRDTIAKLLDIVIKCVGAKIDEYGDIVGANTGDQTGREICTGWYYNYPWTSVLRFMGDDKQVSQKSSTSKSSGWIKNESWYGVTAAVCNVRSAPSTKVQVVAQYGKGEKIYYDSVYEGDRYRWISYISWSGERRYVAYRKLTGDTSPWIRIA